MFETGIQQRHHWREQWHVGEAKLLKAREGDTQYFNITWYSDGSVSQRVEFLKVVLAADSYQV